MQLLLVDCPAGVAQLASHWGYAPLLSNRAEAPQVLGQVQSPPLAVVGGPWNDEVATLVRRVREGQEYAYLVLLGEAEPAVALQAGVDAIALDTEELASALRAGKRVAQAMQRLRHDRDRYQQQALRDPLTGLYNRTAVLEMLDAELSRARRTQECVGVVMADVDHFKGINDGYGHLAGDAVLREVARRMRLSVRVYDGVGRYGGEEFLLVFPHCDQERTHALAERIRQRVVRETIRDGQDQQHQVSLSLGISVDAEGARHELLEHVRIADEALYRAKAEGRNRVALGVG